MRRTLLLGAALLAALVVVSCSKDDRYPFPQDPSFDDFNPDLDESGAPAFDSTIRDYNGRLAADADADSVGSDEDIYWEANSFKTPIGIRFDGATATVTCANDQVAWHTDGAHVVLDLQSGGISGAAITLTGRSSDGSLKIYGEKKFKLELAGVELTSTRGPAINSQCKKRCFVHLADGSTNRLTDAAQYGDDCWYPDGTAPGDEDRKGCFFSEGNLIFSGTGALIVAGRKQHGIASDGYLHLRPGVTIAVTEAAKNALHIKGDKGDNLGIRIAGGYLYTCVAADAGKGLKSDYPIEILGGELDLNCSGRAVYDADEQDTSSAAGIKTDSDLRIAGGTISVKSTGEGGKGLNAGGSLAITGGTTTVVTTGGKYVYDAARDLEASPKGVKAEGDIVIDGGALNISVTGRSDGSEGLESKSSLTINGGELYIYAYDDAINAAQAITINGGRTFAYAVNNDGIDSNGTLTVNGGLVIAAGSAMPEEAFDCDRSSDFRITGGTLIGTSGTAISPASSSTQRTVICHALQLAKDDRIAIADAAGRQLGVYQIPRAFQNGVTFFFSSPELQNAAYTLSKGGTLTDAAMSWNGWTTGGSWSGGTTVCSFTCSSTVTVVGQSGGPGGMPGGGGPGGPRP